MIDFTRPVWLLLLLAIPGIAWVAMRMSFASLGPVQKWVSLGLRIVIWFLLVSALAGVQLVHRLDRVSVVVVRDSSDSIDNEDVGTVNSSLEVMREGMKKDDTLGRVNTGALAYVENLPINGMDADMLSQWQTTPRGNFTNLAEGIQLATAIFPDNSQKRLLLISDGNENIGNALAESRVARDNDVEIYVAEVGSRKGEEVVLSDLKAPGRASLGESVRLRFVVDSTVATGADITLRKNGQFAQKERINIKPGKELYEFITDVEQSGVTTYELQLEPDSDTIAENNSAYAFSVVSGQPRLLYATGDPGEINYLPQTIRTNNIEVDVVPPGGIPYAMEDFQIYDGIIFSDVAAYDITPDQMEMIKILVHEFGKGFMMIGGEESFGPGGYFNTPIEEVLPVDMDFRRKKITPSSLVIALVDKSGSMSMTVNGVSKIEMAREACKELVRLQREEDYVGVMGFDSVGQWVVEPQAGINKQEVLEVLGSMQAGGGTDLYPALKNAYDAGQQINAQIKHVIIFTDGVVAPGPFEELVTDMVDNKFTVSTVAFGADADIPFMQDLAEVGQGRMYEAKDLSDLPRIFTREVFMANKATINEDPFSAIPTMDHPLINAIGWGSAPYLYGYVATSAKDSAEVPLVTHKEDPLLATWHYGLGKSAAFTSDAKNRWARDWLGWGGYERFWTGVARWIRSDLDDSGVDVVTEMNGNEGHIVVTATDDAGSSVNYQSFTATVVDPELKTQEVRLTQTGPGTYESDFDITDNGNYYVNITRKEADDEGNEEVAGVQLSGLSVSYSPEYRDLQPNTFLLSQLKDGSLAPAQLGIDQLFTENRVSQRKTEDFWEQFALIALLLWLIDVAVRRLVLDSKEWREAFAALLTAGGSARAKQTSESLAGLLNVKQGVAGKTQARQIQTREAQAQSKAHTANRREQLDRSAGQIQQAGGRVASEAPKDVPAGNIVQKQKPEQDSGGLADLRRKMADRGQAGSGFDPSRFQTGGGDSAARKQEPEAKRPQTERELTSSLLDKIKKKK
ncbi:VWA domain-containing protein [bacterium]|nr:VWA domain-containing protein [bacterium]